jgi:hypothetical protein
VGYHLYHKLIKYMYDQINPRLAPYIHKWKYLLSVCLWKCISEFNRFMVQLTWGGISGPAAIYIRTERIDKLLTDIFESNYCRRYF